MKYFQKLYKTISESRLFFNGRALKEKLGLKGKSKGTRRTILHLSTRRELRHSGTTGTLGTWALRDLGT